jgi:hypothetical protein
MSLLRRSMKYKCCGRITAVAILMSFLTGFPASGDQPTMQPGNLSEGGTRRYGDSEVDALIDELTSAAVDAIEKAAGEAAKAAALAGVEREAVMARERAAAIREAERLRGEYAALKRRGIRNSIIAGTVCFVGGFALGIGGALILAGR